MKTTKLFYKTILLLFVVVFFHACGSNAPTQDQQPAAEQTQLLLDYFLQHGDYINDAATPAIKNAGEIYPMLATKNLLVVDVRPAEQFAEAHIPGAINVQPADMLDFMLHQIEAPAFDAIVFVDNRGQVSAYVTAIMRLIGFDNTFS
ncbi:rhodanese-like domain-containing protein, partial [Arthrospira platensis SPKY1]|nr:rhodanese-like domain-containing protein [Arthrospira platensis SPKY1]